MSIALAAVILVAAVLYSSVGHAGASGYLAAMALFGFAPATMKPVALSLNICVAIIATIKFARAGCFKWSLFWPFAVASVPFAALGGWLSLPGRVYKIIVGIALLYGALRLFIESRKAPVSEPSPPPVALALLVGAALGFLSGLTGVGGGIFLSPLLLFMGWADTRTTAGVSAAFILVNSVAGLVGQAPHVESLPAGLPLWVGAAIVGGFVGSHIGSRRLGSTGLKRMLAVVLVIAGLKLMLT